ncbi:hypothetical protein GOP47_0000814 [Adiantum capillus-veneris]|uniref:Coenzyme Q-binding protein COQ10 START domain-containing protein n=1 Tax=Adiantum capillus-veneris TaxID=13818 RepID=A0A9D4VDP6_ADICA|nr:hypothetical protein GOP47_0000814 [Adiantum capillus-veneris]
MSQEPDVSMKVEEGVFKVSGSVTVEADPETVHSIIRDHRASARVFQSLQRVDITDHGKDDECIVTQHSQWRFLFWSGVYSVTLRFKHDPLAHTSSFCLEKPGMMRRFNGFWTITSLPNEKLDASMVVFRQEIQLAINPPAPFARFGGQIMVNQVKSVLNDIVTEASRMKNGDKSPKTMN